MSQNTNQISSTEVLVICPKHGEHEHAIISNIEGHEGVWCQMCWTESMGPSLPYKKRTVPMEFKTMDQTTNPPDETWKTLHKE